MYFASIRVAVVACEINSLKFVDVGATSVKPLDATSVIAADTAVAYCGDDVITFE